MVSHFEKVNKAEINTLKGSAEISLAKASNSVDIASDDKVTFAVIGQKKAQDFVLDANLVVLWKTGEIPEAFLECF